MRLVLAGDVAEAGAQVQAARELVGEGVSAAAAAWLLAAEAAVGASRGDDGAAETGFAAAAEDLERRGNVYDAAEVRRAWGVLLNRPEPIDSAIDTYRRTGAAGSWVELARAERERISGRLQADELPRSAHG